MPKRWARTLAAVSGRTAGVLELGNQYGFALTPDGLQGLHQLLQNDSDHEEWRFGAMQSSVPEASYRKPYGISDFDRRLADGFWRSLIPKLVSSESESIHL